MKTYYIAAQVDEKAAYLDSDFYRSRVDDDGDTCGEIITGDIAACLEMDGITDSNNVSDETALVDMARKFLRYSFEDLDGRYSNLSDAEKVMCNPTEFRALLRWLAGERT